MVTLASLPLMAKGTAAFSGQFYSPVLKGRQPKQSDTPYTDAADGDWGSGYGSPSRAEPADAPGTPPRAPRTLDDARRGLGDLLRRLPSTSPLGNDPLGILSDGPNPAQSAVSWFDGQRIVFAVLGLGLIVIGVAWLAAPAAGRAFDLWSKLRTFNLAGDVQKRIKSNAPLIAVQSPKDDGGSPPSLPFDDGPRPDFGPPIIDASPRVKKAAEQAARELAPKGDSQPASNFDLEPKRKPRSVKGLGGWRKGPPKGDAPGGGAPTLKPPKEPKPKSQSARQKAGWKDDKVTLVEHSGKLTGQQSIKTKSGQSGEVVHRRTDFFAAGASKEPITNFWYFPHNNKPLKARKL